MGPTPIQLVVVTAVRNAVRAATIIFTANSISRFFSIKLLFCLFIFFALTQRKEPKEKSRADAPRLKKLRLSLSGTNSLRSAVCRFLRSKPQIS